MLACILCSSKINTHSLLCDSCLRQQLKVTGYLSVCHICGTNKDIINNLTGSPTTFICRACYNTTASPQMIKVEVTHISELDIYDLKFVMPGRYGWDEIKGLIQVLKATIPASNREYHSDTKVWTLLADSYRQFEFVLKAANVQIIYIQESKTKPITPESFFYSYSEPTSSSKETKESLMDKLQKLLGCATADFGDSAKLKQLYRRKALEFHPDRNNGDGTRMSELNSIWSQYNA